MKRFINYLIILGWASFLLIGCKDDPILDPTDPEEEEETGLMFPQKEMRGVWIATVFAIDWPRTADFSSTAYDAAVQKASYTAMLDNFKAVGFNTVFVQVRGMADAFYDSPYEPWSASITGTRGQEP